MKVYFECSPEERQQIIDEFKDILPKDKELEAEDMHVLLAELIKVLTKNAVMSCIEMSISCVQQTLESDSFCKELLDKYPKDIWNFDDSPDDQILEKWNKAVENNQYLISTNTIKS